MKKSSRATSTTRRRTRPAAEAVLAYFDARRENFRTALFTAKSWYAVEGIHDFRVETKKLRSLFRLVEYIAPSFAAKPSVSMLRELYAAAGKLRDIDIIQALIVPRLKRFPVAEYFNQLKHDELRFRDEFAEAAADFRAASLTRTRSQIRAVLKSTPGADLRLRIEKQIHRLVRRLNRLMSRAHPTSEQLHDVRKSAKTLRYTLDIWRACYGKSAPIARAKTHLRATSTHLGEWRDTLLALDSVKTFLARKPGRNVAEPDAYVRLQADLERSGAALLTAYERERDLLQGALEALTAHLRQRPGQGPGATA